MNMKRFEKIMAFVLLMAFFFAGGICQATLYYVDSTLTNTTIGGAAPVAGTNYTTGSSIGSGTDGLWHYRDKGTTLASNGYVWETDTSTSSPNPENTDPLIVSVVLPTPGTYRLYGLAELNTTLMDCAFSIGSDGPYVIANQANSYYDSSYNGNGAFCVKDNFTWIMTNGGQIAKYVGLFLIGEVVTTTADEEVLVYVQGLNSGVGAVDQRTSFDGLAYEPWNKPYGPSPWDGEVDVVPSATPSLSWYQANVDDVTKHYLYINDDPNLADVTPITVTDLVDPIEQAVTLLTDTTYYWRVDESISDSGPADSNTLVGAMWTFETIASIPIIEIQPDDAGGAIGEVATLSVDVSSISTEHYTWYKSDDAIISVDDVVVGSDLDTYQVTITASDEAYYYCKITNDATEPIGSQPAVYTNVVELAIHRLLAHYKLEQDVTDFVGSNDGTVIDSNSLLPITAAYVTGVIDSYGIDLTDTEKIVQLSTTSYPNAGLASGFRQGTISAWVKTTTITGNDCIVSNWNDGGGAAISLSIQDDDDASFFIRQDDGTTLSFDGSPAGSDFSMNDDTWHLVSATYQLSGTCKLYVDGLEVASATAGLVGEQLSAWQRPVLIGSARSGDDRSVPSAILDANVDDVRIYNYMLSNEDIAGLYLQGPATSVCYYSYDSEFDFNNDCKVDLVDFAEIAGAWLSCGRYPITECN